MYEHVRRGNLETVLSHASRVRLILFLVNMMRFSGEENFFVISVVWVCLAFKPRRECVWPARSSQIKASYFSHKEVIKVSSVMNCLQGSPERISCI